MSQGTCVRRSNQASRSHRVRRLRVYAERRLFKSDDQSFNLAVRFSLELCPESWPVVSLPAQTFVPGYTAKCRQGLGKVAQQGRETFL